MEYHNNINIFVRFILVFFLRSDVYLYNNATSVKQFSSGAYLLQLLVNGKQKIEKFIIEK
jgi:hypothetical protein